MRQLVIGLGEVGTAIQAVLKCEGYDFKKTTSEGYGDVDVLHICFPYSDDFIENVKNYQNIFGRKEDVYKVPLVVVHSTVPVGTCGERGWIHSPVRGVHPRLEQGIRTFVKFFGGARAREASELFIAAGIKVYCAELAAETEAMKLWDTTIYGWNILIEKAIQAYCSKHGLDFSTVYSLANITYNRGYAELGLPQYQKYVLKDFPGPVGGHCVLPNLGLLDDPIADVMKKLHNDLTGS